MSSIPFTGRLTATLGRTLSLLTGLVLSLVSLGIGLYLLPNWLVGLCGAFVGVSGGVLLASRRWSSPFDRLFGLS